MGLVVRKNQTADVRLASQKEETFYLANGRFIWFEEEKYLTAYVIIETEDERNERLRGKENEEILIGTELLMNCQLQIDFPRRKVAITKE